MIMTRTPLRLSFVGGGSDLPSYYETHGGAVISTAIQHYVYLLVKRRFEPGYRISYSRTENVGNRDEINHPLVRHALDIVNTQENLEIVSMADVPSSGTGLGSSSSFSVGLLNALSHFSGSPLRTEELAQAACDLEIVKAGSPIGKQDQYAAAYGGFRVYCFNQDETVTQSLVNCTPKALEEIDNNILAFYIGGNRDANEILKAQSADVKEKTKIQAMGEMVNLVWSLKSELESENPALIGKILHENWLIKRSLSNGISDFRIDEIYEKAIKVGCSGGKLLGAGGGGFMIFHTPTESVKYELRRELNAFREVVFKRDNQGSSIQYLGE